MECRSCSGEEKLAGKKASCLILRLAQEWGPSKAQYPVEWHLKVLVCTTKRLRQKQELLADAAASSAQNKALYNQWEECAAYLLLSELITDLKKVTQISELALKRAGNLKGLYS